MRRHISWTAVAVAAFVLVSVMAGGTTARADELRIGFLAPMTGFFAQIGKDMSNGFKMYLDEVGGKFEGMPVKFILEDSQGKPAINVTKAQKLLTQDKVHMFIGGLLASTGYALAPVAEQAKVPYISPVSAADDLTQRKHFKYFLRTGWTSSQPSHPFGEWAYEQGYRRIVTIGADYAFGYEVIGGFHRTFEKAGGKIIQKLWTPIGTKDFGPYIPQIKQADAVFTLMVGPMSLQFPKQYKAAGLKMPLLGGGTSADEFALPFMGDEAIGYVTALQYSAAIKTEKNRAFVTKYRKLYGKVPSYYSETTYTTAQWIHETIKKAGGTWPGTEKFMDIFKTIELDSVRGPVKMDHRANPIHNIYIRKVEKIGGELWNTVVKTYPAVSQYWTFGEQEFLKQPVYSRNFPPCKHC
ncbi:MAG: ABC transporter substrate-binding protein [Candidatus Methylomirabilales bacterium]